MGKTHPPPAQRLDPVLASPLGGLKAGLQPTALGVVLPRVSGKRMRCKQMIPHPASDYTGTCLS